MTIKVNCVCEVNSPSSAVKLTTILPKKFSDGLIFKIKDDIYNSSISPKTKIGLSKVKSSPSGSSTKGSRSKLKILSTQPS